MSTRFRKISGANAPFIDKAKLFFGQYWLLLVVVFLGFPPLYRYIKKEIAKTDASLENNAVIINSAQNSTSNPTTQKKKAQVIQKKYPNVTSNDMDRYSAVALKVAVALGTNVDDNHVILGGTVSFHNVSAWSEDEELVIKLLKTVPTTYPIVADLYYSVHTKSRNLTTDLIKLLSKSELEEIRKVQRKYGKSYI